MNTMRGTKRAIGIIRVSQVNGRVGESFASPDEQRERIRAACERDGLRLIHTYDEMDVSGGAILAKRPGLSKAVAAIEAGDAEVVAAAYFDRLFRSLSTQAEVVERVEQAGGQVVAVDVGEVTNGSAGQWLSGTMLGAVSEYYRRSAKDRGNQTADAALARGVPNRVPFGYMRNADADGVKATPDLDSKALVPDPEVAPYVKRIFQMRADGYSWPSISRWLADERIKPSLAGRTYRKNGETLTHGGDWTTSALRNLISNEIYLGVIALGLRRRENAHEALITLALFDAAQSTQTVQRTGRNAAGAAGGLLVCGGCGRRLSVTGTNPAYTCRRTAGGKCERPTYVSRARADEYVEQAIVDVLSRGALDVIVSSRDVDRLRQASTSAQSELESFVVNASALDARVFKLGLDARQTAVDNAREAYERALAAAETTAQLPDVSGWAALDLDGRRRVARDLISEIVVAPPASVKDRGPHADVSRRFEIRWKCAR
jgi:DNA invertase Pin-like site-specific DNA recombinase